MMGSPPSDFKACLWVTLAIEEMKALGKSVCREESGVGSSVFHPEREDHREKIQRAHCTLSQTVLTSEGEAQ